jgi:hypothetical protein
MFSFIFALFICCGMIGGLNTFAQEEITYEGCIYETSKLSKETIDWIETYNLLSEQEKVMLSHVPYELRVLESQEDIKVLEAESGMDRVFVSALLPKSGGEAVYNPSYWNDSSRIRKANCYAYAMDVICANEIRLQPGSLAGATYKKLTAASIIAAAKKDGPYLGNGRTIRNSSENDTSTSKSYKVALVLDTSGSLVDYHWYTQNSNGYWSHKRGWGSATDLDASGNYIINPRTCNRNYGYFSDAHDTLNYSKWGGYLMVTRK